MTIEDGDLTVAVDGLLDPTTQPIERAITTLWQTLQGLDIGDYQRQAMYRLLGGGDTLSIERLLDGEGRIDWPLHLASGGTVTVRVWRGDGLTTPERVAARYVPEQQAAEGRAPGLWAVRDRILGGMIRDDEGHLRRFAVEASARAWISSQVALAGYRGYRQGGAE
ncbi:hypothetical protein RMN57_13335 [Kitasatospora sp. CM 4170]|uniref:Uncharacterized protein n=1 Tax=Kitasatospora aburaviensis TaxID=67265 RepID=A0ABW1EU29_9ACTN|nr:hypothetical protein [Kitasatospora sp. CM 4170]WNM45637.1 hypothetical protein RMN57_13335 [Kitasatospora sp. CM 4170]